MPRTEVVFFAEENGDCLLITWMDRLPRKAQDKCIVRIERLGEMGYELRRPEADFFRDGIYELRAALGSIQYRILYFFNEKQSVISRGLIKQAKEAPPKEIDLAIERKTRFALSPLKHTYAE